jgi:hypothetical protein
MFCKKKQKEVKIKVKMEIGFAITKEVKIRKYNLICKNK